MVSQVCRGVIHQSPCDTKVQLVLRESDDEMTIFPLFSVLLFFASVNTNRVTNSSRQPGESRCIPVSQRTLHRRFTRFPQQSSVAGTHQFEQFKTSKSVPTSCNIHSDMDSQSKQERQPSDIACRSNVTCTYDSNRFPPVLYQAKCVDVYDDDGQFECQDETYTVWLLRRQQCQWKKNQAPAEKWVWSRESVTIGCNVKNTKENTLGLVDDRVKEACG